MFKKSLGYIVFVLATLNASNIETELGVNLGLNSTKNENGNKFENPILGLTYQNSKYVVSPRVDIDYTKIKNDAASGLIHASLNGVYEYENRTILTPYGLAGLGYEYVSGATKNVFESHAFVQAGAGVSMEFNKGIKARLEAKGLQILGGNNENNEFIITAGVSMPLSFRKPKIKPRPIVKNIPIEPISVKPIVMRPKPPKVVVINNNECSIKIDEPDFDRDGISDAIDQCPATPCNFTVDSYGCPIKATLQIHFETNSATIERYSMSKIDRFSDFLLKNRGSRVKIVGHTDNRGIVEKNQELSYRRAMSVVNALVSRGVSSSRLRAEGKGESMPIASNETVDGRAMNRRIEAELFYLQGE